MPFKIVQTIEKGKFVLDIVPHKWEKSGTLYWPRKNVEILKKFDQSEPEDNWITYGCILKKANLMNYQKAEYDLARMRIQSMSEADTDIDDTSSRSRRVPSQSLNYDDINNQPNSSNYSISGYSKIETLSYEEFDDTVTDDNISFDGVQQNNALRPDILLAKMNIILRNLRMIKEHFSQIQGQLNNLNEGQVTLLNNINQINFQLQSTTKTRPVDKPDSVMEPIKNLEEFENFDQLLRNPEKENELIQKYSIICGVGKGRGINNAYELIDALFDRHFLPECSWAGGSKTGESKICFKSYTHTINFFFKLIHMSDKSFSLTDCHDFLKIVLRNSRQRCASKNLRKSAPKFRRKKQNKINEDPLDNTETALDPSLDQSEYQVNQSTDEEL